MSPANPHDTASAGADSPPISEQLYVLQTKLSDGSVTRGTAGLPYKDMCDYLGYLRNVQRRVCKPLSASSLLAGVDNTTQIIPAPAGTPRLRVQHNTP